MAITQSVLAWTLLGLLLTWMVTFAVLAIHPHRSKKVALEDIPTPSHSFPVVAAPAILRVLAHQQLKPQVEAIGSEPPGDFGATPVA
jgi:hypothetical protein